MSQSIKKIGKIIANGFREALRICGFFIPRNYPVELWVWETMQDDEVCEACLERGSWPAMDIADWMKQGMPGTPEANTHCKNKCRCQLIRYQPPIPPQKDPKEII